MISIEAKGMPYEELNRLIRHQLANRTESIRLKNVNGQRYIGDALRGKQKIIIEGTPGNDLAAYMDGLFIEVKGNAQDGVGNTMNDGLVVIHGDAGDTLGYALRGGEIFVKGNVGYRVGIHMKEYKEKIPVIVVGGSAGDFLGEYMAGGIIIVLGLGISSSENIVGNYCGTGMHGGVMYIRGEVFPYKLGKEVQVVPMTEKDIYVVRSYVERYNRYFDLETTAAVENFRKLLPLNKSPYGNLYTKY
ncbi:MAG: hypothetical protein ACOY9Y_01430 [Bacillota bacterium]